MTLQPEISFLLNTPAFWNQTSQPHVIVCGLRIIRNLKRFSFIPKLEAQSRAQILRFITTALQECPHIHVAGVLESHRAGGEDKELLTQRFPFLEGINQARNDETFVLDQTGRFLALINLREHLELHLVAPGENLDQLLTKICEIESYLGQSLEFAFHQRFGFLSSDPRKCGTGLFANAILHLPALVQTGKLEILLKEKKYENILVHGIDSQSFTADFILVQNKQILGLSEEAIVQDIQSFVSRLVVAESSLSRTLQETPDPELLDKVSRAFGLLKHSYLLDTVESMKALSLIKLGLVLGWIKGISFEEIHHLLLGSKRLYLRADAADLESDLNHKRATRLHEAMSSSQLII